MYRYYKKNQMNVMEYEFDSITEFIDYLDNTPISLAWNGKELASEKNNYSFCKTHSLQEAKDLCKYGLHEKFDILKVIFVRTLNHLIVFLLLCFQLKNQMLILLLLLKFNT